HPEDQALVRRLREGLLRASGCATTFGYGSSGVEFNGQLRQGGRQDGASLQITGAHRGDLAIPGRPYPLGILQQAEAVADYRALAGSARRVLRVHCDEVGRGLGQLARAVEDLLLPVGN
ncbi:MAG: glucose-6-phosphate isomerase, partial [Candidatus Dormibacteria bacterium]